eukprot:2300714-Prymnesium_polylepis.1
MAPSPQRPPQTGHRRPTCAKNAPSPHRPRTPGAPASPPRGEHTPAAKQARALPPSESRSYRRSAAGFP